MPEVCPNVWVLQHASCETLGTIGNALRARGVRPLHVCGFRGEPVPAQMDAAGLIVLGGPMGVSEQDRYPFLRAEMRLIEDALARGVPILGVCLGAQLVAAVLGAPVTRAPQAEIGWFPLVLTDNAHRDPLWAGVASPCPMFHWHDDRFDCPPGAVALASSARTPCQAFRFGDNAYGFQFHLEVTEKMIADWADAFPDELAAAGVSRDGLLASRQDNLTTLHRNAGVVFGRWAALLGSATDVSASRAASPTF